MLRDYPFEITLTDEFKQLFAALLDVIQKQQLRTFRKNVAKPSLTL